MNDAQQSGAGAPHSGDRPAVYESFVDRQVREAMERGAFDGLPGAGRPIPGLGGRHDPDWWIRRKLADEDLRGVLPPPLALRREREEIQSTLQSVVYEDDARAIVDDLNTRIMVANRRPLGNTTIITPRLDVEAVIADWRARRRPHQR